MLKKVNVFYWNIKIWAATNGLWRKFCSAVIAAVCCIFSIHFNGNQSTNVSCGRFRLKLSHTKYPESECCSNIIQFTYFSVQIFDLAREAIAPVHYYSLTVSFCVCVFDFFFISMETKHLNYFHSFVPSKADYRFLVHKKFPCNILCKIKPSILHFTCL